jgi:hypothetical protein
VDDQGNPLPERYQGVVDLPLLGKVDMQKFSPFKDVEALATTEGLVSSLQFAIQDVVRAGLGVAAPGTKASVKVDKYGRLVPDVSLGSQLGASFAGGPQGALVQSGDWKRFFGIPTVSQDTLNKAGARNVLSQAEVANADQATQQKAASAPVDSLALQQNLRQKLLDGSSSSADEPDRPAAVQQGPAPGSGRPGSERPEGTGCDHSGQQWFQDPPIKPSAPVRATLNQGSLQATPGVRSEDEILLICLSAA